ncbi:radical SAM family heme chaperone HemW [Snodgrassella sp. CFCC 13594]|uniref:radical SAM family heme chaperone HemW n=1 Tax=Snodgrassella sp. CFCC 13594 TaxID=1775559 RepID=UPI0009ECD1E4|nr:radical SAM family heme chaperone HemW [Snodgrassella sp. CFCC 13594]
MNAITEQVLLFSGSPQIAQSVSLSSLPPLSLYVHIPWCVRKCPYCDFNSHQAKTELDDMTYVAALLADLEYELPHFWGRPIHTVFIGGGTPSLFSARAIDALLSGIRARTQLLPGAEITLEANPGTFERHKFHDFAQAGVNRLSIGVQSFSDDKLRALGRIHNGHEAESAIAAALSLFDKVNVDLMYALPSQNVEAALSDMNMAIACGVSHISAYQLTMEPNTAFGHTPPPNLPDDERSMDIEDAVHSRLAEAGFIHYETSAFARAQQSCQHNLNYWQFGDYVGIGAGAHGKISSATGIVRTTRSRHPKDYLAAMGHQPEHSVQRHTVTAKELPFEFMMNALRLQEGVPSNWFAERTGLDLAAIQHPLAEAVARGLLHADPRCLKATPLGQRFLNDLLTLFLPETLSGNLKHHKKD